MAINMPEGALEVNGIHTANLAGQSENRVTVNIEKTNMQFSSPATGYSRKGGLRLGAYNVKIDAPCGKSCIERPKPKHH